MRKPVLFVLLAIALLAAFFAGSWFGRPSGSGAPASASAKPRRYICPMHPQFTSDRPGTAPCCGMQLVPEDELAATPKGAPPGSIAVSPERQQMIGLRTAAVEMSAERSTIRIPGRVAAPETRTFVLNAGTEGWILEAVPIATGGVVKKDQMLASFYSKDFLTAQQTYLYAFNASDQFTPNQAPAVLQIPRPADGRTTPGVSYQNQLLNLQLWIAEDNLQGLGMSSSQIKELAESRKIMRTIHIKAPADGFLLSRSITAGQRFDRGQELFRVADLSQIWVYADLFPDDAARVKPGMPARVTYRHRSYDAHLSRDLPQFDAATRTLKVRLEVDNPGFVLRPDMFVDVEVPVDLPAAITVPVDAIMDSGLRKTVYVDRGQGWFEPREIITGWRFQDRVQIVRGLSPGDRIVVAGNFLLDSESRMRQAASGVQSPVKDLVCGMDVDRLKAAAVGRVLQHGGQQYFFCSDQCKREFERAPDRFASGGERARAMPAAVPSTAAAPAAHVELDPICMMEVDPKDARWKSDYSGRTYYFCSEGCKRDFDKEPAKYAKVADAHSHAGSEAK